MYIGQFGTNPWLKSTWLNNIGMKQNHSAVSSALSQVQVRNQTKAADRDRVELSGSYAYLPNRLQVLETPEATQVESNLNQAAELRPASEKEYTEEDALMNQYMKQYRLDFIKVGDSYELDTSKPVKLMLESQVSQESLDAFRAELEKTDWETKSTGVGCRKILLGWTYALTMRKALRPKQTIWLPAMRF